MTDRPRSPRPWVPVALLVATAGCRATEPKQAPIDLDTVPGPTAAAFNKEASLRADWPGRLLTRWASGEDGFFTGAAAKRVHYHVVRATPERGAVVVLPGRTEPALKYAELADDLAREGWTSWILDLRGQGESERLVPSNPQAGHVEFFQDYVDDLETFLRDVVRPAGGAKPFALGHSTGGGVLLLHADQHPGAFRAMVATSPLLEPFTGAFPGIVAASLSTTTCSVSDGTGYVLGGSDYVDPDANDGVTTSAERFLWKKQLFIDRPELRLGSATWRWVCESVAAGGYLQHVGRWNLTPTLLFTAGDDSVVKTPPIEAYCAEAPRCQLKPFPAAQHELLQEQDAVRNETLSLTLRFFQGVP